MKAIPSPRTLPLVGTLISILAEGGAPKLHLYVDKRHKQLGPIFRDKIGSVTGIFIADGNYIRKIFAKEGKYPRHIVPEAWIVYNNIYGCQRGLLFMDGEEWAKFRKTLNNIMLKAKQDQFSKSITLVAEDLIETWKEGGLIKNLEKHLYKWSLEVIVAALLGSENYIQNKRNLLQSIEKLAGIVHQVFIESASLSLIPITIASKLKFPVWKRFVEAASSTIHEGKKMVNVLVNIEKSNPSEESLLHQMIRQGIHGTDLKRIVTDLILAAGDTTAYTMQWLLHLLSMNLSSQHRLYKEIKDNQENVFQCQLLKGSLKEALRLYPVAPFITRFMPQDIVLDEFLIKSNELVLMSLYSSGRNDKYFPSPSLFLPERWLRSEKGYEGVINPNASLPFAIGFRSCIGKKIAETQILITLSKILQNFIIKSNRQSNLGIALHLISVPEEPIEIILEPRKFF